MYYTYILYSAKVQRYYAGSTQDVQERLSQHNSDYSRSTRGKGPWIIVRTFEHETRSAAVVLEMRIKKRGIKRFLDDLNQPG